METTFYDHAFLCVLLLVFINAIALLTFEFVWRKKHPEMYLSKTDPRIRRLLLNKYDRVLGNLLLPMWLLWSLMVLIGTEALASSKYMGYILSLLILVVGIITHKLGKKY